MLQANVNKHNSLIVKGLICFSLLAGGFIIGKFVNIIQVFQVDKDINLVELTSVFVNILLVIYISTVIDKNKQDTRIEKDILIKRVEEISKALDETVQKTLLGQTTVQEAASQIKTTNIAIDAIYKLMEENKRFSNSDLKIELKSNIKKIRSLLTTTPINLKDKVQKSNMSIEVKNNIILLTMEKRVETQSTTEVFKQNMIRFQFLINRS